MVLVFALVYNSFYFSSEPLLMTSEHVAPWPFHADTVEVMCCYGRQVSILRSWQRAELLVQGRTVVWPLPGDDDRERGADPGRLRASQSSCREAGT